MSLKKTISEYKDAVIAGLKNGNKIIEALVVAAQVKSGNASVEALAEILKRKDICTSCPFNSKVAEEKRGYESSLHYTHCTLCLCRIGGEDTKEYCLSCVCGMDSWNKRNPDKPPMELKWTAFEETKIKE